MEGHGGVVVGGVAQGDEAAVDIGGAVEPRTPAEEAGDGDEPSVGRDLQAVHRAGPVEHPLVVGAGGGSLLEVGDEQFAGKEPHEGAVVGRERPAHDLAEARMRRDAFHPPEFGGRDVGAPRRRPDDDLVRSRAPGDGPAIAPDGEGEVAFGQRHAPS